MEERSCRFSFLNDDRCSMLYCTNLRAGSYRSRMGVQTSLAWDVGLQLDTLNLSNDRGFSSQCAMIAAVFTEQFEELLKSQPCSSLGSR